MGPERSTFELTSDADARTWTLPGQSFKPRVAGSNPAGGTTFPISERTSAARTRRAPGPGAGRFDSNYGLPSAHAGDGWRMAGRRGNLGGASTSGPTAGGWAGHLSAGGQSAPLRQDPGARRRQAPQRRGGVIGASHPGFAWT